MASRRPSTRRIRRLTSEEIAAYDHVSSELTERVRIIRVPDLPGPYLGMALGRYVLLATDVAPNGSSLLLAHELVHVQQWAQLGIPGFLYRYLRDFARGIRRERNWQRAYRQIEAEEEARRLADAWAERRGEDPRISDTGGPEASRPSAVERPTDDDRPG